MGALALIGLAATAVGAGVSAYGQEQAGESAANIDNYNAQQQVYNAKLQQEAANNQAAAMAAQSNVEKQQTLFNQELANTQAQAQENNAQSLQNQAVAQTSTDRNNIERTEIQQQELVGKQRSAIAASGVVETGSPLDVLAQTSGNMQSQLNMDQYQSNLGYDSTMAQSRLQSYGADLTRAGSEAQTASGLAQSKLLNTQAQLEQLSGAGQMQAGQMQANLTQMQGAAALQGSQYSALGSIFSGLSNLGTQWRNWNSTAGAPYAAPLAYSGSIRPASATPAIF